jgi:hypothetical protein
LPWGHGVHTAQLSFRLPCEHRLFAPIAQQRRLLSATPARTPHPMPTGASRSDRTRRSRRPDFSDSGNVYKYVDFTVVKNSRTLPHAGRRWRNHGRRRHEPRGGASPAQRGAHARSPSKPRRERFHASRARGGQTASSARSRRRAARRANPPDVDRAPAEAAAA